MHRQSDAPDAQVAPGDHERHRGRGQAEHGADRGVDDGLRRHQTAAARGAQEGLVRLAEAVLPGHADDPGDLPEDRSHADRVQSVLQPRPALRREVVEVRHDVAAADDAAGQQQRPGEQPPERRSGPGLAELRCQEPGDRGHTPPRALPSEAASAASPDNRKNSSSSLEVFAASE